MDFITATQMAAATVLHQNQMHSVEEVVVLMVNRS